MALGRDEDRFTGPRISSLASLSLLDNKAPEASQIYTFAQTQCLADLFRQGIDYCFDFRFLLAGLS